MRWSLVVPAKRLGAAKTRLRPLTGGPADGGLHAELVLALLADTVAAARACPAVADVVVVTDDERAAATVRALGARTVPDVPDRGLNPALVHGARTAATGAVAALSSDLPALRPAELAAALAAAAAVPRCFVADAAGTGTTLLAAAGVPLDPRFGRGSAAAHAATGAAALAGDWPGLRRDVDTPADLTAAVVLGVGPATAALLPGLPRPAA
ncbi:2-phospho-L-lactate guanylyltransferase [Geodermatophilus bullaregiensis]|uniref:2-phospho-L-lactate guanylyltransferase n=1 Tax=Geodermatophilus bullaregiensis TaxID=1564160 RepID=UPI0027DE63BC|nr:2-phospho-L-lactate guanylyltransferase [Geodermatophilus bullaregiensis]MBM7805525.1 2-phospho-L-lactate guanylyltransferase [Geodermatophilus bullaregiensis]